MPKHVKSGGEWKPVTTLWFKDQGAWLPVQRTLVKQNGSWVETYAAAVVALVTSTATNLNVQTLFSQSDWTSPFKKKVVVIEAGVIVGSLNPAVAALLSGTGRSGAMEIVVHGEIQGAGGDANSGVGGVAINLQQTGVTIINNGAIRGGGGGGGRGGDGGAGRYDAWINPVNAYQFFGGSNTFFGFRPTDGAIGIVWYGTWVFNYAIVPEGLNYIHYAGNYRYRRGSDTPGHAFPQLNGYAVIQETRSEQVSAGGRGGEGGRGQGFTRARTVGSIGAAGGQGAGSGGSSGDGGGWGLAGADGSPGTAGNVGSGAPGNAGGPPGAAITGQPTTVINNGTINGTF